MGALLFPWEAGYWEDEEQTIRNPKYGKAEVRDWKTLVERIRKVREDAVASDKLYEDCEDNDQAIEDAAKLEHHAAEGYKDIHRRRCRV